MEIGGIRTFNELSSKVSGGEDKELGKTQFLELMIAQLDNQDPLDPAKNEDFIAQLAQFSSVEGIQNLNDSVAGMANAMQSSLSLQAASLVGRSVLAPADTALYEETTLGGSVSLTQAVGALQIDVESLDGSLVQQLDLGPQSAGLARFAWDGRDQSGNPMPAGLYRINAYSVVGGERVALEANLPNRVAGVTMGERGVLANLVGGIEVSTLDIKEIR